jgi:hypothetical protein
MVTSSVGPGTDESSQVSLSFQFPDWIAVFVAACTGTTGEADSNSMTIKRENEIFGSNCLYISYLLIFMEIPPFGKIFGNKIKGMLVSLYRRN